MKILIHTDTFIAGEPVAAGTLVEVNEDIAFRLRARGEVVPDDFELPTPTPTPSETGQGDKEPAKNGDQVQNGDPKPTNPDPKAENRDPKPAAKAKK